MLYHGYIIAYWYVVARLGLTGLIMPHVVLQSAEKLRQALTRQLLQSLAQSLFSDWAAVKELNLVTISGVYSNPYRVYL